MLAKVVTLRPLSDELYYQVPDEMASDIVPGSRVQVPLGRSQEVAFVRELFEEWPSDLKKTIKLKNIIEILDAESLISENDFKFYSWLKDYYFYPFGEIVKRALPNLLTKKKSAKLSKRLEKIEKGEKEPSINIPVNKVEKLNQDQLNAIDLISSSKSQTFLLHGVTGSGKTEVYMDVIKRTLDDGKEALVLVPEIALTPQLVARFEAHFGDKLAKFHSGLTEKQRLHEWLKVKFKKVKIAIGVRSAIFLPFENLGVIVVDEEHENTFKQDDRLKYNARDVAVLRGKLENATVILGSATPSLETFHRAETSKYKLVSLPKRAAQVHAPQINIVNLRFKNSMYKNTLFTEELFEALKQNLEEGKQSLLFLNRTGFSNFVLCSECGESVKCPNCSISLIYYKSNRELKCSYCDYRSPVPKSCPSCDGKELEMIGGGTERIEEDLNKYLPAAKVARMDRETVSRRGSREKIIEDLSNHKVDILVGTQMIAKGLDFHNITLVGVVMADSILGMPDFKSAEKTFQLLAQVSGRSGRGIHSGKVYIQTYNPDHYAVKYVENENYIDFYKKELPFRKELDYPPFSRLVSIKISGNVEKKVVEKSREVASHLRSYIKSNAEWRECFKVLGPAPQMLYIVRNKFRYHVLIKSKSPALSNALLKTFTSAYGSAMHTGGVKISFDIDPVNIC